MKALLYREWLMTVRRLHEVLQPIVFLLILVTLLPIAVGTDTVLLQRIAPGIIWVAVLLSVLLSAEKWYKNDVEDGSLEQLFLSGHGLLLTVAAKFLVQWCVQIVPMFMALPLLGLLYELPFAITAQMALTLLIGSPSLLLLAMLGSAMTLSVSRGGLLLIVLILPLYIPILIFAVAAVSAAANGFSNVGQFAILGAILMLMITLVPFAIVAAIRVALSE